MMTANLKLFKTINILLWIAQVFLALTFMWAGSKKLFQPEEFLFICVKDNSRLVFIAGIIDLLAAFGIILPTMLRIQPKLTIYAAYRILALMISASLFQISRGEATDIGINVFIAMLAVFIAWGRQTKAPITSKNY